MKAVAGKKTGAASIVKSSGAKKSGSGRNAKKTKEERAEETADLDEEFRAFVEEQLACLDGRSKVFAALFPRYMAILGLVEKRRKYVHRFVNHLHDETSWLDSPASRSFHLNIPHGLLIHSLNVAETMLKLKATLAPSIPDESVAIVGLFHDVGKIGYPGRPNYIRQKDGSYILNDKARAMALATRSLYLIAPFIPLTPDEAQAIAYHDGQYVPEGQHVQHRECPLLLLAHHADMWSAHVIEDNLPDVMDDVLIEGAISKPE